MSPSKVTGYGVRKGEEGADSERQEYRARGMTGGQVNEGPDLSV